MSNNLNLNQYYSKISEIRNRILSKHKAPQQVPYRFTDVTFSENINASPIKQSILRQEYRREEKAPLNESVADQRCNVNFRVKELDDINGKIKNVLSQKRSAQKNDFERNDKYAKHETASIIQKVDPSYKKRLNFGDEKKPTSFGNNQVPQVKAKDTASWNIQQKEYKISNVPSYLPKPTEQTLSSLPIREVNKSDFIYESFSTRNKKGAKEGLIKLLLNQVELDTKLRGYKQEFQLYNNPQKQKLLETQLKNLGLSSKREMENWTVLHPQERNPFLNSTVIHSFQVRQLVASLIKAKDHWQNTVKEAVSIKSLENQNFTIRQIDTEGKGFFALEDFVCFLNMNSESCFRNRDLFSMFKRLQKIEGQTGNQLGYVSFLNYMAK